MLPMDEGIRGAVASAALQDRPSTSDVTAVIQVSLKKRVAVQVKLRENGYWADEDDMKWWQFGSTTASALQTFQACAGVPESGVCDAATWRGLLGPAAMPADIDAVRSGGSDDEDLDDDTGRVYLLGEQRWATL